MEAEDQEGPMVGLPPMPSSPALTLDVSVPPQELCPVVLVPSEPPGPSDGLSRCDI